MLLGGPIPALYLVKGVGDSSNPLHFLTPPAPWGLCVFCQRGIPIPHSLGVGENGNKTLRMRAADFFYCESPFYYVLLISDKSKSYFSYKLNV